jgi:hypothetical protein
MFPFAEPLQHGSRTKVAARAATSWDNPAMDKDRDLLPWILGGLSMATVALAMTVASTNKTATPSFLPSSQPTAPLLPQIPVDNSPAPTPPPVPTAVPTLGATPLPAQTPSQPLAANQIWECTINGQKTFASKPCGGKSTLREVGPINTMEAAPLLPPSRYDEPQSGYPPDYYYPSPQDSADSAYPIVVVRPFVERRRPDHTHRPHHQERGVQKSH